MSFIDESSSSLQSEAEDSASDFSEERTLGLEELLCDAEIDRIFRDPEFIQEQESLNPQHHQKHVHNFLADVRVRMHEDLHRSFLFNERQPCQHLFMQLVSLYGDDEQQVSSFVAKMVRQVAQNIFFLTPYDEFFGANDYNLKTRVKLSPGIHPISQKLIRQLQNYYKAVIYYIDRLMVVFDQVIQVDHENANYMYLQQLQELKGRFTQYLQEPITNAVPFLLNYEQFFEQAFLNCFRYFSTFQQLDLGSLSDFKQSGVEGLDLHVLELLKNQNFNPLNNVNQRLDKMYAQIQKQLAEFGRTSNIDGKIHALVESIVTDMLRGTEAVSFVIRKPACFDEVVNYVWKADFDQQNRIRVKTAEHIDCLQSAHVQKEVFAELLVLDIQNQTSDYLLKRISLLNSVSGRRSPKTQFASQMGSQNALNPLDDAELSLLLEKYSDGSELLCLSSRLLPDFIEEAVNTKLSWQARNTLCGDLLVGITQFSDIEDVGRRLAEALEALAMEDALYQQSVESMVLKNPILLENVVNWIIRCGTVSVVHPSAHAPSNEAILAQLSEMYAQITNTQQQVDPESPQFFFRDTARDMAPTYNFNDPFAPVLYVSGRPVLLNSKYSACGINRWGFMLLAFLMEHKGEGVQVKLDYGTVEERFLARLKGDNANVGRNVLLRASRLAVKLLRHQARQFVAREAYYQVLSNINLRPYNFCRAPPKLANHEFVANYKNQKVCVCLYSRDMVRFVVVDQYGHYISQLALTHYLSRRLFNPLDIDKLLESQFKGYLDNNKILQEPDLMMENPDSQAELKAIAKGPIVDMFKQSFARSLNQDYDEKIQRLIDEARLIDFLAINAVQVVVVAAKDFQSKELLRNVQNTVNYLQQCHTDLPEDAFDDLENLYVPTKGIIGMVNKNPLYIPGLVFKPLKLAQFINKIAVTETQIQIPSKLASMKEINRLDLSCDSKQQMYFVANMDVHNTKAHRNYFETQNKYLRQILNNQLFDQFKDRSGIKQYGLGYRLNGEKLEHVSNKKHQARHIPNYDDNEQAILFENDILTAIWVGRFLSDPLACYAALTLGGSRICNLIDSYLINLLPQFCEYKQQSTIGLIKQVSSDQHALFKYATQGNQYISQYLHYAMQTSICKRSYDINLMFVNNHYVYTMMYLPHLTPSKLFQVVKYCKNQLIDNQAVRGLLYGQSSAKAESINFLGEPINGQASSKGVYLKGKEALLNIILQTMLEQEILQRLSELQCAEQDVDIHRYKNMDKLKRLIDNNILSRLYAPRLLDAHGAGSITNDNYQHYLFMGDSVANDNKLLQKDILYYVERIDRQKLTYFVQRAQHIYQNIQPTFIITNDALLLTPTSPYAVTLSYEFMWQQEMSNMKYCLAKLLQLYRSDFEFKKYQVNVNNIQDYNRIDQQQLVNDLDEKYFIAARRDYDSEYGAVACVFGDITRSVGYDDNQLESENSDLSESSGQKKKKHGGQGHVKINYNSQYCSKADLDNIKWYDYLPINGPEAQLLYLITYLTAQMGNNCQFVENFLVNFDSFQQDMTEFGYRKMFADHIDRQHRDTDDVQLQQLINDYLEVLNNDMQRTASQLRHQLFYNKRSNYYYIQRFAELVFSENVVKNVMQAYRAYYLPNLLQYLKNNKAEMDFVRANNRHNRKLVDQLALLVDESSGQALPVVHDDDIEDIDMDEIFDIYSYYIAFKQQFFDSDSDFRAILGQQEERLVSMVRGESFMLTFNKIVEYENSGRISNFWYNILDNFSQYDGDLKLMIDIEQARAHISQIIKVYHKFLLNRIQNKFSPVFHNSNFQYSIIPVSTTADIDNKIVFLYMANERNYKKFSKYEQFQVQVPRNRVQLYKQNEQQNNYFKVTQHRYDHLQCYVHGVDLRQINIEQSFVAYLDSICFDQNQLVFTTACHQAETQITDVLSQYYENGWRAVLLQVMMADFPSIRGKISTRQYTWPDIDMNQQFNNQKFNQPILLNNPQQMLVMRDRVEAPRGAQNKDSGSPDLIQYRISLLQYMYVLTECDEDAHSELKRQIDLANQQGVGKQEVVSMLWGLVRELNRNSGVTLNDVLGRLGQHDADVRGMEVPEPPRSFPVVKLLREHYVGVMAVMSAFGTLGTNTYKTELRRLINPQVARLNFERVSRQKLFRGDLIRDEVPAYFGSGRSERVVFIPKQNSYDQFYMYGLLSQVDSRRIRILKVNVYEDTERKPVDENGIVQMRELSQRLLVRPYEQFKDLSVRQQPEEQHYNSLEEVYQKYLVVLLTQLRDFVAAFPHTDEREQERRSADTGKWIQFADARLLEFTFMTRINPHGRFCRESMYVVYKGFVFRHTFIPGGVRELKAWLNANYRDFGLRNGYYQQTEIDRAVIDD